MYSVIILKYFHCSYEPRCEKIGFLNMRKKDADQLRGNREADQRLFFSLLG